MTRRRPGQLIVAAALLLVASAAILPGTDAIEFPDLDISLPNFSLPEGWKLPTFDLPSAEEIRNFLDERRQAAQERIETALVRREGLGPQGLAKQLGRLAPAMQNLR
jgi:hypothetical protein